MPTYYLSYYYKKTTFLRSVVLNLLNDLLVIRLNQVWQSDITYYEKKGVFYYITFIIDSYSRRIIGHSVSKRLLTEFTTLPALKMTIKTRKNIDLRGLIFHSDGGGQYYADVFLKITSDVGIIMDKSVKSLQIIKLVACSYKNVLC